ncbi:hypothetical protein AURDEDRAFT_151978 [Auricularia subglabra TFB-10046 SS5]|nr:hypothetical protein AURDEDRAFT_151978 [Auricularia subglabra TFB-10046 SS5]
MAAPRIFTTSTPASGVLLVERPLPAPEPATSLSAEPPTMEELRARRLVAFGVAPPARPPSPPPPPGTPSLPHPALPSSSPWTQTAPANNALWTGILARHSAPRASLSMSSRSPTILVPAQPPSLPDRPAKRRRVSNPYSATGKKEEDGTASNAKAARAGGSKSGQAKQDDKEAAAQRARFAARLADEDALMFVRVGPPPQCPSAPAKSSAQVRVKPDANVRAHLAGVLQRRGPAASSRAVTPPLVPPPRPAAQTARRVPFAKAAAGQKRGLSTWHSVQEDEDEDVVEVSREEAAAGRRALFGSAIANGEPKPLSKSTTKSIPTPAKFVPTLAPPDAKPKLPSLNSGGAGARVRQTTLPFSKKPSGNGKG